MSNTQENATKNPPVKNAVVITHAPKGNYRQDYAALPRNYGTSAYYNRSDIKSIMNALPRK